MSFTRLAVGIAAAALLTGCGDPDAGVPLAAPANALTCADDLDEIVELLRAGAPVYDYDPAVDLTDLATRADAVVAGPIERLIRSDDAETIFLESSDLRHFGANDAAAPASGFDIEGGWARRDVADPLTEPVDIEGVEAIAFLFRRGDGSGRFTAGPQGLHIGCSGSGSTATSVLEPLPPDSAGTTIADLTIAVEAVFARPTVEPTVASTVVSTVVATTEPTAAAPFASPLWELDPEVTLRVDGTPLVDMRLGSEIWDGETAHPPEPEPAVGIVVTESAPLELTIGHPARGTLTFFRLDEQLRFVQDPTLEWDGTTVVTPAPEVGTWFVDMRAEFGPSDEYGGQGVLRAGAWLQVVPVDSPCATPAVAPVSSPDSIVTGVVACDGCPVVAGDATLDLDSLTPWYHCAPWPPALQWRGDDGGAMTHFWQYVDDPADIETVAVPDDALATGRFLPSGEVLTVASDPDALFVRSEDGTAQRWFVPVEQQGCA